MPVVWCIIATICLFLGSLAQAVSLEETLLVKALQLVESKDWPGAQKVFVELLSMQPEAPLYLFNFANILNLQGDSKAARDFYLRVAKTSSPLAIPSILYAVECELIENDVLAALDLYMGLRPKNMPPNLQLKSDSLQEQLRQSLREKILQLTRYGRYEEALSWILRAESLGPEARLEKLKSALIRRLENPGLREPIDLGDFSEVESEQKSGELRLLWELAYDSNLYGGTPALASASVLSLLNLDGSIEGPQLGKGSLVFVGSIAQASAATDAQYRYSSLGGKLLYAYPLSPSTQFSLTPGLSVHAVGLQQRWNLWGIEARWEHQTQAGPVIGFSYHYGVLNPTDSSYQYLSGTQDILDLYVIHSFFPFYFSPTLSWERDSSQDLEAPDYRLPYAYHAWGGGLSASYRLSEVLKISMQVLNHRRQFDHQALPDAMKRIDQYSKSSMLLRWYQTATLNWTLRVIKTWNSSNLDRNSQVADRNFERGLLSLGLEWGL